MRIAEVAGPGQTSGEFEAAIIRTGAKDAAEIIGMKRHALVDGSAACSSSEWASLEKSARKNGVALGCTYRDRLNPALAAIIGAGANSAGILVGGPGHVAHGIDAANALLGGHPESVFAGSKSVLLGYAGNKTAVISMCEGPGTYRRAWASFEGRLATADLEQQKAEILREGGTERLNVQREDPKSMERRALEEMARGNESRAAGPAEAAGIARAAEAALLSGQKGIPIYLDLK